MKPFVLALALATVATTLFADPLGEVVRITPIAGWVRDKPDAPGLEEPAFPTLRYTPKNGRNASVVLTLLPVDVAGFTVTNHASLQRFNLVSARPYLFGQEEEPTPTVLDIANGIGVYITNEDPALIGKPVPPGEYRRATSASVLLGRKYLIHCTIFYDEKDSPDLHEALEILLSATVKASGIDAPATNI